MRSYAIEIPPGFCNRDTAVGCGWGGDAYPRPQKIGPGGSKPGLSGSLVLVVCCIQLAILYYRPGLWTQTAKGKQSSIGISARAPKPLLPGIPLNLEKKTPAPTAEGVGGGGAAKCTFKTALKCRGRNHGPLGEGVLAEKVLVAPIRKRRRSLINCAL